MKETALWRKMDPHLATIGKFQKISDKFTGGISDVIGCLTSRGVAMELKELKGVRVIRTKFRPGQLDWLEDWRNSGGLSLIVASHGLQWYAFPDTVGIDLEAGVSPPELLEIALWTGKGKGVEESFCKFLLSAI